MLKYTNAQHTAASFNGESFSLAAPEDWTSIGNGPTREAVMAWLAAGNAPVPFNGDSLDAIKKRLAAEVDEHVGAITLRFERFSKEYEMREAEAQAYKRAGYAGPVPRLVANFAGPARMGTQAAADRILSQAILLRAAIPDLGDLRMRKYEILYATSAAEAQRTRDLIIETADSIAAKL